MFNDAVRAAVDYKKNSTDFMDEVMKELEVWVTSILINKNYDFYYILFSRNPYRTGTSTLQQTIGTRASTVWKRRRTRNIGDDSCPLETLHPINY